MIYTLKGRLCGFICNDCSEPLSKLKVRLYRTSGTNVTAAAVANPKHTFAILDDAQVEAKTSALLAEVETDDNGAFTVQLGEKSGYNGEAFDVDVYCGTVPRRKPGRTPPPPLQFSITTLQPQWRQNEQGALAAWEYCLPWRLWCLIRARFGAWVICGRLVTCEKKEPLSGIKVRAFDVDWLQDDELGSAFTDGSGRFRIDYLAEDFKLTPFSPFINVEWVGGPDLYFKFEDGSGTLLFAEPPSRGRQADRQNIGPCFCTELCLNVTAGPPVNDARFTSVGDFDILADIDALSGLTNKAVLGHGGPGFGFTGGLQLSGFCPKVAPFGAATAMRYRFLFEREVPLDLSAPGQPGDPGNPAPLLGARVVPMKVGSRLILWDTFGTGLSWTVQSIFVAAAVGDVPGGTADPTPTPVVPPGTPWGPPPPHVATPDAAGWVEVDQSALDGGFFGLMGFNSHAAVPGGLAPGSGAGVAPATPKNGANVKIRFEAARLGEPPIYSNALNRIHINNWQEVNQLNLLQFTTPGAGSCSGLSDKLDILYTADHELMGSFSVAIDSAAAIPPHPPLPSGIGPRGGVGSHHVNIGTWPSCSYKVWLHTTPRLTNGTTDRGTASSLVTFCK